MKRILVLTVVGVAFSASAAIALQNSEDDVRAGRAL